MSEEDTVRAADVVDGEIQGDALIHPADESPVADPHTGNVDKEAVVVDQQMLDENPVLAEAGVEVGAVGTEATPEQAAELDAKAAEETPAATSEEEKASE